LGFSRASTCNARFNETLPQDRLDLAITATRNSTSSPETRIADERAVFFTPDTTHAERSAITLQMTLDHASSPGSVQDKNAAFRQTLLPQSRETGDVIPPKQPDGSPIAAKESPFAKSWAHLVAGGYCIITSTRSQGIWY
jgi:hypothetical protein